MIKAVITSGLVGGVIGLVGMYFGWPLWLIITLASINGLFWSFTIKREDC